MWQILKRKQFYVLALSILAWSYGEQVMAQQNLEAVIKDKLVQINLKELAEAGSQQMIPMLGDKAARNAKDLGDKLIALAGKKIPIRIVGNKTVPTAIGNLEIVLPYSGMDKYTDAQVLFVVAHELAHIEMNHTLARIQLAAKHCPSLDFIQPGYDKRLDQCIHVNLGANQALVPHLNSMRREQEHEADLWAVKFLSHHELPIDYKGALEKSHQNDAKQEISHPSLAKRLAYIEKALLTP